jgi:hypothetical protein
MSGLNMVEADVLEQKRPAVSDGVDLQALWGTSCRRAAWCGRWSGMAKTEDEEPRVDRDVPVVVDKRACAADGDEHADETEGRVGASWAWHRTDGGSRRGGLERGMAARG